jgi:PAS domain S-box-containing protein
MQGRYVNANAASIALVGLEREEQMVGKTDFDFFPHELAVAYRLDDQDVLAGKPILNREEQATDTTGNRIWFLTIKVPLRSTAGDLIGLLGIARNINDRKSAEAERQQILAKLQLQIERMPLAYLLCDGDFRYTRWNPVAERMFGYREAEVLGKHPFDVIVPPESQSVIATVFAEIKAGSMETHGISVNRRSDGARISCEWHNTPLFDEQGAFVGLLSLAQDVTDRTRLEEQLRRSQRMEAVGRLAGGVAHDFNNLLTIITGYTQILLMTPEITADVRDTVQAISAASDRAAALTRQLLAFSRQTMLQPQVLNINDVVAETSRMLERLIGEDISFTTVLAPDLAQVRVDPGQLDQVLMNLAVNARDAMPRGGKLTIETRNAMLDAEYAASHPGSLPGPHVMLAISDTGDGMTPEIKGRIFEPFFTTKGVGKGTGLGLAMVLGIVEQSGGHIHVYSEPGAGSSFKIYFPAVDDPTPERNDMDESGELRGAETILIVEDEEMVRRLSVRSLQMHGYIVLTAVDGQDALRVIDAHEGAVDLLLTDVVMPNMSGPELARALQQRFPGLKVLFMSGYTDDAVVRHGLLQAEVSFIQKPYTPRGLAQRIRQVLDA